MKTTHLQGVKWKASHATDQQPASRAPHSPGEQETVSSRRSVGVRVTGCATDSEGPRHTTTALASWDM